MLEYQGLMQCAHLRLLPQLLKQGGSNGPRANNAHCQGQRGQVKAPVHSSQGLHAVLLVQQDGDVVLAAALCNGPARARAEAFRTGLSCCKGTSAGKGLDQGGVEPSRDHTGC